MPECAHCLVELPEETLTLADLREWMEGRIELCNGHISAFERNPKGGKKVAQQAVTEKWLLKFIIDIIDFGKLPD